MHAPTLAQGAALGLLNEPRFRVFKEAWDEHQVELVRADRERRIQDLMQEFLTAIELAERARQPRRVNVPHTPSAPTDRFVFHPAAGTVLGTVDRDGGQETYHLEGRAGFVDVETLKALLEVMRTDTSRALHIAPAGTPFNDLVELLRGCGLQSAEPVIQGFTNGALVASWWERARAHGLDALAFELRRIVQRVGGAMPDPMNVCDGSGLQDGERISPWRAPWADASEAAE